MTENGSRETMSQGLRRFLLGVGAVVAVAVAAWLGAQSKTNKVADAIQPLCVAVKFQNRTLHVEHKQKLQQRIPHSFFPDIPPARYQKLIAQSKAQEQAILDGLNRVFVQLDQKVPYC